MSTCIVLGAGATLANAEHFHRRRQIDSNPPLDTNFFDRVRALRRSPPAGSLLPTGAVTVPVALSQYATGILGFDPFSEAADDGRAMRMEEFFKDLFYDVQSAPVGPRRRRAAGIYAEMVTLYASVIRRTTDWIGSDNRQRGPVGRLLAAAATDEDLSILTFNHDLVAENELMKRATLRERWCVPDGYGTFGARLRVSRPRGDMPIMRIHRENCDHAKSIKVLKLHGSLNWYVRMRTKTPPVSLLLGQGGSSPTQLTPRREIRQQVVFTREGPGRKDWRTWPVIVPPVYGKQMAITGFLSDVWADARAAVTNAERLVFVGYSLPPTDVEAEKLFQRALAANEALGALEVVNPDPGSAARYATLFHRPLKWFPDLDQFIKTEW